MSGPPVRVVDPVLSPPDGGEPRPASSTAANIARVARREYAAQVRSRLFLFSTLFLAGIAVAVALIPLLFRVIDQGTVTRVAIVAPAGEPALGEQARGIMDGVLNGGFAGPADSRPAYVFEVATDAASAIAAVAEGRLSGAILIGRGTDGGLDFVVHAGDGLGADRTQLVAVGAFAVAILDWTALQPPGGTPFVIPGVDVIAATGPSAGGVPISGAEYASRRVVGIVFTILAFLTLVIYGMWVAAGVAAEKSSRVMELLISAATAPQLVLGKIAGIGLAGLTQIALVLVPAIATLALSGVIGNLVLGPDAGGLTPYLAGLSPGLVAGFLVYFVLGFALFAAIYAAAGSLVSRPEDVQMIALPLSLLAIAGYLQAVLALTGGVSTVIRLASYIPFWSPFVMVTRLAVGRVEPWEVVISLGFLLATVPLVTLLAIRVYRAGVLLYGQRPTWRLFIRVLRGA